jgi:hypothetical protein
MGKILFVQFYEHLNRSKPQKIAQKLNKTPLKSINISVLQHLVMFNLTPTYPSFFIFTTCTAPTPQRTTGASHAPPSAPNNKGEQHGAHPLALAACAIHCARRSRPAAGAMPACSLTTALPAATNSANPCAFGTW